MRNQRRTDIKVGAAVLLGFILIVAVYGWAKNVGLKSSNKSIKAIFETVSGLEEGDPVTVNGIRKGYVEKIYIEGNNAVLTAVIDGDVDLRADAQFSISMLDLMGGKKVEIRPGISPVKLDYNMLHRGKFNADVSSVMAMVGDVQSDLLAIVKDLRLTLTSVNSIIADSNFHQSIRASVNALASASGRLDKVLIRNEKNIDAAIYNSAELTGKLNEFMGENKESMEEIISEISIASKNANNLLEKINLLTDETLSGKNNAGKLLYDEELINEFKISLSQIKELTQILNEQLKGKGLNVKADVDLF